MHAGGYLKAKHCGKLTVAMSTAASVTLDDPGTRLVDFDELFEVLDPEEGERGGSVSGAYPPPWQDCGLCADG